MTSKWLLQSPKNMASYSSRESTRSGKKTFHTLLNKFEDGAVTLVFDCEKNLMLPKVKTNQHSRQLHLFNFTVVRMVPTKKLGNANVTSYVWTEDERPRGSSEIASAMYDTLTSFDLKVSTQSACSPMGAGSKIKILLWLEWLLHD